MSRKPKLRDSVLVAQRDDGSVDFLVTSTAVVKTFEVDPVLLPVIARLDGTRSVADLEGMLPADDASLVGPMLECLEDEDLLEGAGATDEASRPLDDRGALFDRPRRFIGEALRSGVLPSTDVRNAGDALGRLSEANVLVLGLGAVGSAVANHLLSTGVGRCRVVDPDDIATSDVARSAIYGRDDVGQPKARVAAEWGRERFSAQVDWSAKKMRSAGDVAELVDGIDLVVNCADEPSSAATARWVAEACMPRGIPHYVGGGYAWSVGTIGMIVEPGVTPCWACFEGSARGDFAGGDTGTVIRPPIRPTGSLQLLAGMVAAIASWDAIRVLLGAPPLLAGRVGELSLADLSVTWRTVERRVGCELCERSSPT